jgi:hypothetical protein
MVIDSLLTLAKVEQASATQQEWDEELLPS